MRRVDYITYDDEGEEQLTAGVGLVDGQLKRIEGDAEFADILLSNAMLQDEPPEVQMEAWSSLYNNQIGFATEPYDDDDENYGPDGMFIGGDLPDGVEFAFCPTGPGGGQDNSCGGPGQGKVDTQKLKDDIAALETKRQHVVNQIKEAKASGKSFSALKKQRATLNKQIVDKQNELSDHLKGVMKAAPVKSIQVSAVKGTVDQDAVVEMVMTGAKDLGFKFNSPALKAAFIAQVNDKIPMATAKGNAHGVKVKLEQGVVDDEAGVADLESLVAIANNHGGKLSKLAAGAKTEAPALPPAVKALPQATHAPDAFVDSKGDPVAGSGVHRFSSTEAKAHYNDWANKLPGVEEKSIQSYTANGYKSINKGLREGLIKPELQNKIDRIDSALAKAPPLAKDILVHRGVSTDNGLNVFTKMEKGDVFLERGFVSTSIGKDSAFGGSAKLNIKVPAGTKAGYVSTAGLGIGHEKELLLPRDSKFKVVNTRVQAGIKIIDIELIK